MSFFDRFRNLSRERELRHEFERELRFHTEERIARNLRSGLNPGEAQAEARRHLGNLTVAREDMRAARLSRWLDEMRQDVRYAARTLRSNRAFAAAAAATLALAIGANTAMFSVVKTVLLQPLPFESPEQLAMLWIEDPSRNIRESRSSLRDVHDWRTQSQRFADIATFDSVTMTLTGADGTDRISGASISANLLSLLGVQPLLGRGFSAQEAAERQPVVLISHRLWQTWFRGSKEAVGATLVIDGRPRDVVGVLPVGFAAAHVDADVWEPHAAQGAGSNTWFVVGRLRPTVTIQEAQAEMSIISGRLNEQVAAAQRTRTISVVPLSVHMVGRQSRLALWMLGGAVFCVLLIAAANVASLSLARTVSRTREMAVRSALGASAGRIVRQLLVESVVLAAVAGVIGTLLALAGIPLIRMFGPENLPRLNEVGLDIGVLGWALAITVLVAIVVGLPPALLTLRLDLRSSAEERGKVSGGASTNRVRRALVVAEFALAIVLLVGAGLLIRSWWHVERINMGFRPDRVFVIQLTSPPGLDAPAQRTDLYHRVLEEIQAVPGVESAGVIDDFFIENNRERGLTVEAERGPVSERLPVAAADASEEFFTAIGTPLVRGRFFSRDDSPEAPPVAIINETMARRYWPGSDPVGRRLRFDPPSPWYTVVGVVADLRRQGPERDPVPQVFRSLAQSPTRSVKIFIRTASDEVETMSGSLRAAVRRVDRNAAIYSVTSFGQQLRVYFAQRRFQTSLLTGFSIVALLMAAVGIYGLIQYSVATRTQEIGLRMAVGARAGDIFRMVIGEGLMLSVIGVAMGLVGAWWLGRAGASLLFGVTATDPLTLTSVSLLLTAVAAAASYFPARRAMTIDPMVALRTTSRS
jgi:putative ABC transport system permease protein